MEERKESGVKGKYIHSKNLLKTVSYKNRTDTCIQPPPPSYWLASVRRDSLKFKRKDFTLGSPT